jgi:hypothetical protein
LEAKRLNVDRSRQAAFRALENGVECPLWLVSG